MKTEEKKALKAHMQKSIKTINQDIIAFEDLVKPVSPDNAIGRLTRMEAINSKSINEAALMKAQETRLKLERSLSRIDDPDFGVCRECEELIPLARLMALPETDVCVSCAQQLNG